MERKAPYWAAISLFLNVGLVSGCEEFGLPGGSSASEPADQEDDTGGKDTTREYSAEPGSCNDWKISYCEAVESCSAFSTQKECEVDVGYVRCAQDAPFGSCRARIDKALAEGACDELPTDCDPVEIADRSVPASECGDIYGAICEFGYFCGAELSIESCLASLQASSPCSQFTAVLPQSEACVDAISVQGCGDPLPAICTGVLRR